ncbi:MAG TPA: ABC transporter permease subunit [Actinomycetes bacterium]|nr:ABC transporter permease subunit [Actinomycetes bacterium]
MSSPAAVVARLGVRQVRRGTLIVAGVSGFFLAAAIAAYDQLSGAASSFDELAANPGMRALLGVPWDLTTSGGFVAWRAQAFIALIVAIWAALAATRVFRGEEERGHWDLLLAAPLTRARGVSVHLALFVAAGLVTALVVLASLLASGEAWPGSLLFGGGVGLVLVLFAGVGAVTSQLVPQRRLAAGLAGITVGAFFLLRMAADVTDTYGWLRWLTPFGWLENLRAFSGDDPAALLLLGGAAAVTFVVTVVMAQRRDLGAGVVQVTDEAKPRLRLLGSADGFAVRRRSRELIGWGSALLVLAFVYGGLGGSVTDLLDSNPQLQQFLDQLGMTDLFSVTGYIALMASLLSVVIAVYPISVVHAEQEDEEDGRLDLAQSGAVTRSRWLGALVWSAAAAMAALALLISAGLWLGGAASGAGLSAADAFGATVAALPVPLLVLGIVVLLHGVRPAWAVPTATAVAVGGYLVELFGPAFDWPNWVMNLSPYHHLAMVPVEPVAWPATAVLLGLAVGCGALGFVGYHRRDLV